LKKKGKRGSLIEAGNFVLDSYALIGYLENESFADRVQDLLLQARDGAVQISLHVIHLGEVYYITLRERGSVIADLVYARIKALPLNIIDCVYARIKALPLNIIDCIDEKLLLTAATLKAYHPISYADALAGALAKIQSSTLLTGDPEFAVLESQGIIKVEWLG